MKCSSRRGVSIDLTVCPFCPLWLRPHKSPDPSVYYQSISNALYTDYCAVLLVPLQRHVHSATNDAFCQSIHGKYKAFAASSPLCPFPRLDLFATFSVFDTASLRAQRATLFTLPFVDRDEGCSIHHHGSSWFCLRCTIGLGTMYDPQA